VAGYSRLTGMDEEGTHAQLTGHLRSLVDPKIAEHHGRVVKNTGDGVLAEFSSVVEAVRCAVDVQRGMVQRNSEVPQEERIEFRIGINVGDIIIDSGEIFGDGVNVAVRLESLAEPGGICISDFAYQQVRGKIPAEFVDIGEQQLKNIARPVRAYNVSVDASIGGKEEKPALTLPDKPSIAVLPFQNMSGDPEQEYFADGMAEDIITALSRTRRLFVIARNSTFTYKGRAVDVKQVGRELGVRYVLEGSVRKAANRVRITGQLIDTSTGAHLWADRFDGTPVDIFDLQDQVTASVVGAIAPKLEQAEIERARRKPTESLDAYDYYLHGMASFYRGTKDAISEALQLFHKAIARDPEFASAYGMAAWCYVQRKNNLWMTDRAQETAAIERLARQAARLGKEDPTALYTGGYALAQIEGHLDAGIALIDRALALDPNLAAAWHLSGWMRIHLREPEVAIAHLTRAVRLNPLDPLLFAMQNGMAAAHFLAGRYDEASSWAEKALREHPNYLPAIRMSAASHAFAGRLAEAQKAVARMRQVDPALRVAGLKDLVPFRRPEDFARYVEGLRRAGLPD
ncbi:MAG: adenylate/guanylate cyclase domain-containing protein, partial [Rhodoplanes sp.]